MGKKETIHRIETCYFYRTKEAWTRANREGDQEVGLLLNEGDLGIIDKFGKQVDECWTWERMSNLTLELDIAEIEERFNQPWKEVKAYTKQDLLYKLEKHLLTDGLSLKEITLEGADYIILLKESKPLSALFG